MSNAHTRLWPYSPAAAILAVPVVWAILAVLFFAMRNYLQWPISGTEAPILLFSIALSAVPLILMLVDFVASRGGVVGSKWFTIDFSKTVVESGSARREAFGLQDNILSEQESITDSGGMRIVATIKKATTTEIVCIDLRDGNAWWVTRLLALCASAVGTGLLKAIVFIGKRENKARTFLGWGMPRALLEAILDANPEYRSRVRKARMITGQIALFGNGASEFPLYIPGDAPVRNVGLHPSVSNRSWAYDENESAMLAKILIEELKQGDNSPQAGVAQQINLEAPPDRLTTSRLKELFEQCLYTDVIDRSWPNDQQLSHFLDSAAPYVAMVRQGTYEGMLRSDIGERSIIRELFARSADAKTEAPTLRQSGAAPSEGAK